MTEISKRSEEGPEKFHTIKDAADLLGLRYWHLQRAVKRGLVPSHRLLTTKRLLRISEVVAAMSEERSLTLVHRGHDDD
jgi:predicted site-specific integrase-resolvase